MIKSDDDTKHVEPRILELHAKGALSRKIVPEGSIAFRLQETGWQNADYFGRPRLKDCGRYNDPTGEFGVWFGAEHPSGAIAESFGRVHRPKSKGMGVVLNTTDLEPYDMCTMSMTRQLVLLDLKPCLSKLGLTIDQISGPDYRLTQAIVSAVTRLPDRPFDGIAYESRHHPDWRSCYALWKKDGDASLVSTTRMTKLPRFEMSLDGSMFDAEEIMTEILGYRISD